MGLPSAVLLTACAAAAAGASWASPDGGHAQLAGAALTPPRAAAVDVDGTAASLVVRVHGAGGYLTAEGVVAGRPGSYVMFKGTASRLFGQLVDGERALRWVTRNGTLSREAVRPSDVRAVEPALGGRGAVGLGAVEAVGADDDDGQDLRLLQSSPASQKVLWLNLTELWLRVAVDDTLDGPAAEACEFCPEFNRREVYDVWRSVASGLAMFDLNVVTDAAVWHAADAADRGCITFVRDSGELSCYLNTFGMDSCGCTVGVGGEGGGRGLQVWGHTTLRQAGHLFGLHPDEGSLDAPVPGGWVGRAAGERRVFLPFAAVRDDASATSVAFAITTAPGAAENGEDYTSQEYFTVSLRCSGQEWTAVVRPRAPGQLTVKFELGGAVGAVLAPGRAPRLILAAASGSDPWRVERVEEVTAAALLTPPPPPPPPAPPGAFDECVESCEGCAGTACADVGQECHDPDQAAASRGDWRCQCPPSLPVGIPGFADLQTQWADHEGVVFEAHVLRASYAAPQGFHDVTAEVQDLQAALAVSAPSAQTVADLRTALHDPHPGVAKVLRVWYADVCAVPAAQWMTGEVSARWRPRWGGAGRYTGGEHRWVPIMGLGNSCVGRDCAYQWTQWGDASGAPVVQDDLEGIRTAVDGEEEVPLRGDDVPAVQEVALAADGRGGWEFAGRGVIETAADSDSFAITVGERGGLVVDLDHYGRIHLGGMLDISAKLVGPDGAVAAYDNPAAMRTARLELDVDPGRYTLVVMGGVEGDPNADGLTKYGSLGTYKFTGVLTPAGRATPDVCLAKGEDLTFDGASAVALPSWPPTRFETVYFEATVTLAGAVPWARLFDFGNDARADNVVLGFYGATRQLCVKVYREGRALRYLMGRPGRRHWRDLGGDALAVGVPAKVVASIVPTGVEDAWGRPLAQALVTVDGRVVIDGEVLAPRPDAPRASLLVGASNWAWHRPLKGSMTGMSVCNALPTPAPPTPPPSPVPPTPSPPTPAPRPWWECAAHVTVPTDVTSIPDYRFKDCELLASIAIHDGVASIGVSAFEGTSALRQVALPAGLRNISPSAFRRSGLISVAIPEGVAAIAHNTFRDSAALAAVAVPAGVASIGGDAFSGCTALASVSFAAGSVLSVVHHGAFSGCSALEAVALPPAVEVIGHAAFADCTRLAALSFGDGSRLRWMQGHAFRDNAALAEVTFPRALETIGNFAFQRCGSLARVAFEAGSSLKSIGSSAFSDCAALPAVAIPPAVEHIQSGAFGECTSLAAVTFGAGSRLATIGSHAFFRCTALESVALPPSLEDIHGAAFAQCERLKSVTFGTDSQLSAIGDRAFAHCGALTAVAIPAQVASIGELAFVNCRAMESLAFAAAATPLTLANAAFKDATSLRAVAIPRPATLSEKAFSGCAALETLVVDGAASLKHEAFAGCTALSCAAFLGDVAAVGEPFSGCRQLVAVSVDGNVEGTLLADTPCAAGCPATCDQCGRPGQTCS